MQITDRGEVEHDSISAPSCGKSCGWNTLADRSRWRVARITAA